MTNSVQIEIVLSLSSLVNKNVLHTEISVEIIQQKEHPGDDVSLQSRRFTALRQETWLAVVGTEDFSCNVLSNISISFDV